MADKNYLRLDKVAATDHYESVKADEVLVNGQFVELGEADLTDGIEVMNIVKTEEGKAAEAVIAQAHLDYGYLDFDYAKASVAPGKIARALVLHKGQMLSFNAENATGIAAGDDVAVAADGMGIKKAADGEVVIGKCIRLDYLANIGDLVVIRVK